MIVKQVPSKKATSSFGGLADYILDKKNNNEKIEFYNFSNCPFENEMIDENIEYIKSMQELNQTAKSDKVLHLIVSFHEDEKPSKELLAKIEKELLSSLGMENHHRLSAFHINTNNPHLHIAINKINPITNKLIDPYQSKNKLIKKASELELKYNLKIDQKNDNGLTKESKLTHNGIDNLKDWIKKEVLTELLQMMKNQNTKFIDIQRYLALNNLEILERGNGFIIREKTRNIFIKTSAVHRDLSKQNLMNRYKNIDLNFKEDIKSTKSFGSKIDKTLWDKYKQNETLKKENKELYFKNLAMEKNDKIFSITKKFEELINKTKTDLFLTKQSKYKLISNYRELKKNEIKKFREELKEKRQDIFNANKYESYKEYLINLSLYGDKDALDTLRKTKYNFKPDENVISSQNDTYTNNIYTNRERLITDDGFVVYKLDNNGNKIIDKGTHLKVTINKDEKYLLDLLNMSIDKFGKNLEVNGDIEFKKNILIVAEKHNLDITFKNVDMEQINTIKKDNDIDKNIRDIIKVKIENRLISILEEDTKQMDKEQIKLRRQTIKGLLKLYVKAETNASLFEGDLRKIEIAEQDYNSFDTVPTKIKIDCFKVDSKNISGLNAINKEILEIIDNEKEKEKFEKFLFVFERGKVEDISLAFYENKKIDIKPYIKKYDMEVSKIEKDINKLDTKAEKNLKQFEKISENKNYNNEQFKKFEIIVKSHKKMNTNKRRGL